MNSESSFELTGPERDELGALADDLAQQPPGLVDEHEWISACRRASCRLPERLRSRLRDFRRDPGPDGALLLRGLPPGVGVPPTPVEAGSVQRTATRNSSVIGLVSMELGEPVAFRNEKGGALVQNVVPVPGQEVQQSNAGSTALQLHVENAFHPRRPDFVALLCVRSDHESAAGLHVASVRRAAGTLDEASRQILRQPLFITDPPPSFGRPDSASKPEPILTGDIGDPDIRVDFHASRPVEERAAEAMQRLEEALTAVAESIRLTPGDLALVDNRVALHGRSSFTPRYDGGDRWLHRTFVHLDHRRSRALRAPHGHVLD